jgi:MFS family permease
VRARDGRARTGVPRWLSSGRRRSLGLGRDARTLFWGMFVFQLGFGLYGYIFTLYLESLGATPVQIGLMVGAQGLLRIAVYVPAGIISDRYSRRKTILLTTLLSVPAVLSFAVAQEWWQALPGMLLIVLGNLGTPAFSSYLAEAGSETNRGRAFAMVYMVGPSIALALSPVTGGWLAAATSYSTIFYGSAIAYFLSALVFARIAERPPVQQGGLSASYREAFAVPVVFALGCYQFAVLAVLALGTTLLTNYLKDAHGLGVDTVGWFGSIAAVGSIFLALTVGRFRRLTAIRSIAVAVLAVGILCAVTIMTGNPFILGLAFLGRGGFMVAWSLFASVLSDTTPPRLQSRAFAISEFLGAIGFALAPFAAGALYDWHRASPLVVTAAATPGLAAFALWIERRFVRPAALAVSAAAEDIVSAERASVTATAAEGMA